MRVSEVLVATNWILAMHGCFGSSVGALETLVVECLCHSVYTWPRKMKECCIPFGDVCVRLRRMAWHVVGVVDCIGCLVELGICRCVSGSVSTKANEASIVRIAAGMAPSLLWSTSAQQPTSPTHQQTGQSTCEVQ